MFGNIQKTLEAELNGIYGSRLLSDLSEIIRLYDFYDGTGQDWQNAEDLDYEPTKMRTNLVKKIINEQARFLFGKTPEIRLFSNDDANLQTLQTFVDETLIANNFSEKLLKAAKDCFIGKRVALKAGVADDGGITVGFMPSMSFVFETSAENPEKLTKVIMFHGENNENDKNSQRFWRQKYELIDGKCFVWESVYDGFAEVVEERMREEYTGLDFIPVKIIFNDGLTGDLIGESDVEGLIEMQNAYNRLSSDDVDALKFNMFPQTVVVDGMTESIEKMIIAPGALVDLQTEVTAADGQQAQIRKLESSFGYDTRLEHTMNRIKTEMYELLNVPLVTVSELKGFMTSGKSLKALYWQLVTRCEEKFLAWKNALVWLTKTVLKIGEQGGLLNAGIPDDLKIVVDNVYPLMEDEYEEKTLDLELVKEGLMSRKTFIEKWFVGRDEQYADKELEQIKMENLTNAEGGE